VRCGREEQNRDDGHPPDPPMSFATSQLGILMIGYKSLSLSKPSEMREKGGGKQIDKYEVKEKERGGKILCCGDKSASAH